MNTINNKNPGINYLLNRLANEYQDAQKATFAQNPLAIFIRKEAPQILYNSQVVDQDTFLVEGGVGKGNWANIPWIGIFNKSIPVKVTKGVYIVYLLSKDTNKIYLTLNQGCTEIHQNHTRKETISILRKNADLLINKLDNLEFNFDQNINLEDKSGSLGEFYQKGCIFYKVYNKGSIPEESELKNDLTSMIKIYNQYVSFFNIENQQYYPSLEEYDPQISAETYEELLSDNQKVNPQWLDILYNLYQMGGKGSCKEVENKYGLTASHYNANAINIAKIIHRETDCDLLARKTGGNQYWPILFYSKKLSFEEEGDYCYKLREPLFVAIKSMESKGVFTNMYNNHINYDPNMILYGPPGTGKTYVSSTYAVAICEGKTVEQYNDYHNVMKRYNELKKDGRIAFTTFHQSYGYEDFIESISPIISNQSDDQSKCGEIKYTYKDGIFKEFCKKAKNKNEPYVFIIDEINRGNISKIFGELITLIEDSKRYGNAEAISAILPYSKEEFSVPNNVYIIGTMNTADRSIAIMDTALRRRFRFKEMMPNPNLLENIIVSQNGITLNISDMLKIINDRITFLYDREHTIGHAFFISLKSNPSIENLASIFEKSIIPLLQEYFYEDYKKIQLILGDNDKDDSIAHIKFIKSIKIKPNELFKGTVNEIVDLTDCNYEIDHDALFNILSYKEIDQTL